QPISWRRSSKSNVPTKCGLPCARNSTVTPLSTSFFNSTTSFLSLPPTTPPLHSPNLSRPSKQSGLASKSLTNPPEPTPIAKPWLNFSTLTRPSGTGSMLSSPLITGILSMSTFCGDIRVLLSSPRCRPKLPVNTLLLLGHGGVRRLHVPWWSHLLRV
ncbi:hypothetical protein EX30DRAFT_379467, partial [Ascodesmis nigricans]